MELSQISIELLKAAEYNPRQSTDTEQENLKTSIERFGLVDPIIVNSAPGRANVIIGGHFRVRVAKSMGMKEVPVVYVNIPDIKKEKELNIRLNKNSGSWDYDLLANFDEDMLKDCGFDSKELDKVFQMDTSAGDDDVPDERPATDIKLGDIYTLGSHRLMCGDSTRRDAVESLMAGEKADMVFTDPPYNVDYGVSKNPRHKIRTIENDKQSPEQWKDFCNDLFVIFKEYNNGDIYMWGAPGPEGMKMRLWLTEMGCHWSATIVWKKQQLVLTPANYQRMYEPCFYGWFNKSSFQGDRTQTEVWEIDRPHDSKLHPTMKPIELCCKGIENSSPREGIVLDCFGGSGSTLIACEKLNRKCRMMEIGPRYCQVIIDRWEKQTGLKAVEQAESRQYA